MFANFHVELAIVSLGCLSNALLRNIIKTNLLVCWHPLNILIVIVLLQNILVGDTSHWYHNLLHFQQCLFTHALWLTPVYSMSVLCQVYFTKKGLIIILLVLYWNHRYSQFWNFLEIVLKLANKRLKFSRWFCLYINIIRTILKMPFSWV